MLGTNSTLQMGKRCNEEPAATTATAASQEGGNYGRPAIVQSLFDSDQALEGANSSQRSHW